MSRVVIEAVDIGNRGPFRIVGERIGEWVMAPTIHWFGEDREIRRLMSLWDVRIVGRPEVVWWGGGYFATKSRLEQIRAMGMEPEYFRNLSCDAAAQLIRGA